MDYKLERSWKKVFESDLQYVAIECRDHLPHNSVLILEGPMGAGKTSFAKVFANCEDSSSPSYSVINEYPDVVHADFYRIKDAAEIIHLELPLYLEGRPYFLVEWGLKYISRIFLEVPDDFSFYLLDIEINESKDSPNEASRNFYLKKISEF